MNRTKYAMIPIVLLAAIACGVVFLAISCRKTVTTVIRPTQEEVQSLADCMRENCRHEMLVCRIVPGCDKAANCIGSCVDLPDDKAKACMQLCESFMTPEVEAAVTRYFVCTLLKCTGEIAETRNMPTEYL